MDNSLESSYILQGESKTKDILTNINRINSAKYNDALLPSELASNIITIGEIFSKQLENNVNKSSVGDFENLIPSFDYETKYYKYQKMPEALKIVHETNAAAILSYEERYKENETGFAKAA